VKTLILYATKYGAAEEIARRISAKIAGAAVHDLKQDDIPALSAFDCIIVGSGVYAGSFRKEAKTFLSKNAEVLKSKRLGLFASGMSAEESQKVFADNVPKDVLESAKSAMLLGGIFDPQKANFAERAIMKAVTKQAGFADTVDNGKIAQFAEFLAE